MKKLKKIKFSNGSEGFVEGNINITISGAEKVSEEEIELTDGDAKKILDQPVFYRLKNNKAILKKRSEIPTKHKSAFDKIVI